MVSRRAQQPRPGGGGVPSSYTPADQPPARPALPAGREGCAHSLLPSGQLPTAGPRPTSHESPASLTPCDLLSCPHQTQARPLGPRGQVREHRAAPCKGLGDQSKNARQAGAWRLPEQTPNSRSKPSPPALHPHPGTLARAEGFPWPPGEPECEQWSPRGTRQKWRCPLQGWPLKCGRVSPGTLDL